MDPSLLITESPYELVVASLTQQESVRLLLEEINLLLSDNFWEEEVPLSSDIIEGLHRIQTLPKDLSVGDKVVLTEALSTAFSRGLIGLAQMKRILEAFDTIVMAFHQAAHPTPPSAKPAEKPSVIHQLKGEIERLVGENNLFQEEASEIECKYLCALPESRAKSHEVQAYDELIEQHFLTVHRLYRSVKASSILESAIAKKEIQSPTLLERLKEKEAEAQFLVQKADKLKPEIEKIQDHLKDLFKDS